MAPSHKLSRRRFLGQAACAGVGSTALYSTLLHLAMSGRAAAQSMTPDPGDFRALICLFLTGGNDSFNMLMPGEEGEVADYLAIRADLGLGETQRLPVTDAVSGRAFSLHGALPGLQERFASGDLAFVANVGTLVEPTTLQQYHSDGVRLPLGLFSHSDQSMQWQTAMADSREPVGWGGRTADLLGALNENQRISMSISLGGNNVFQTGHDSIPYALGRDGVLELDRVGDHPHLQTAVNSLLNRQYANVFEQTYADVTRASRETAAEFRTALETVGELQTAFPEENEVADRFALLANILGARGALGMRRQTYFVEFAGWDHHDEVINNQQAMFSALDGALTAFWSALGELGLQDRVTVFTASDFGRTLTSNGEGSDHAWGGNQFVLGGSVNGGRVYGTYPASLRAGGPLDLGRGIVLPTTSVDSYLAELARWIGVAPADLSAVIPNIERFYDPFSPSLPLGFMSGVGGIA